MKLALYRKYRPSRFADVVGQEDVTAALKNQLAAGRCGHAYLFTGIRGVGKTTFAKILAKAVNCPNAVDGEPCGECDICRGIDNGSMLDVTEIDAASNNRVDDVRDLLEESAYTPAVCRMRVYIIDEVHMLSSSAFNALLKTLEEPPAHVLFILATTEIHKVPATILSRCQRFTLRRIPEEKIAARLLWVAGQENIDLTADGAALIARLADGALRDALSILDTASSLGGRVDEETVKRLAGVSDKEELFALSDAIRRGDITGALSLLGACCADSIDPARLLSELIRHYRNLLMVRVGRVTLRDCSASVQARYELESKTYPEAELLAALSRLSAAADRMGRSLDRQLTLELAVLELTGGTPALPPRAAPPQPDAAKAAKAAPAAKPAPAVSAMNAAAQEPKAAPAAPAPERPVAPAPERPAAPAAKREPEDRPPWESEAPGDADAPPEEPQRETEAQNAEQASPASAPMQPAAQPAPIQPAAQPAREPAAPQAADLLEGWQDAVAEIKQRNRMLGSVLKDSRAHVTASHLLIEANEMAMKFIRENADSRQTIKEVVAEKLGVKLPVGPWKKPEQPAPEAAGDGLEEFLRAAEQAGVAVERKRGNRQ